MLYLLAPKEIGFNFDSDNRKNDTKTLEYYVDNTGNSSRIKLDTGNLRKNYWLRSGPYNFYSVYYYATSDGSYSQYNTNSSYGVAPAFRILD